MRKLNHKTKLQSYSEPIILQICNLGLKRITDFLKVKKIYLQNLDYISVPLFPNNVLSTEYTIILSRYAPINLIRKLFFPSKTGRRNLKRTLRINSYIYLRAIYFSIQMRISFKSHLYVCLRMQIQERRERIQMMHYHLIYSNLSKLQIIASRTLMHA